LRAERDAHGMLMSFGLVLNNSRILRLRSRVIVHLSGPFQKVPQLFSFPDHESPEFNEANLVHLQAGIRFHAPAQVGAAPGGQAMSAG
jgi:hypothetical protein